ncbi:Monocarboxylate transporter 4 [Holothuria leucospilota]|uniref:Monocarboxylate transporter 4 n=1 Tax=Holothuria leucospilota TaxID=206669 RepID=A0A9Q0YKB8_HOLLE|nr:Monocarboxylate transporter 4 [Holothuria leucospilota]
MVLFSGSVKSNGVILDDLVKRLGTTNTLVAGAFALQNGIAYTITPFTVLLFTVFTNRQVCVVGGMMAGIGYIYLGFNLTSILQVYAAYLISGIGYGLTTLSSYIILQSYFKDQNLPLVISFVALFDFVGIAALPPVLQYLRSNYGLENSLVLFGAIMWNLIVTGVASTEPPKNKFNLKNVKDTKDKNSNGLNTSSLKTLETYLRNTFSVFEHTTFRLVLVVEIVGYYLFVSWALFLVSLGTTLGLTEVEAVSLSSIGGTGGLVGRIIATFLFIFNKMNACTSSLIPIPIAGFTFFVIAFPSSYYIVSILTFLCGLCLGLNSSGVFGLIPTTVCRDHYKYAISYETFFMGVATQISGLLSGCIRDITGSTIYVFLGNACVCLLLTPLVILWKCYEKPKLCCALSKIDKNRKVMNNDEE